jgi:hypothetical protein
MKGSPLAGTLSFLVPGPAEAALLTVCISHGRAREAWDEWLRLGGDLDRYRSLLPQVAEGARRGGIELDAPLAALLSGALLHESLRLNAIRQIAGDVLDRLGGLGLDCLVVQDLALAETVYPDPALRHCNALELLLPAGAVVEARAALDAVLARADGFPVRFSSSALPRVAPGTEGPAMLERSRKTTIAGRTARVPAPEDALALVLGRAAVSAERRTLVWACDAARLIETHPGIEWSAVADVASRWNLGIPIATMLRWLASELALPVPGAAVEGIARARPYAGSARSVEAALECIRADGRVGPTSLLARAADWRERARVLRWTALPSGDRMRRSYPDVPRPALPLLYVARPFLHAGRTLRSLNRLRHADAEPAPPVRAGGTAAARSAGRSTAAADRASASPRSWG